MDIKIISGTDRPNSNALKISAYIKPLYEAKDASVEIIDLQDFPLGDVVGGKYGKNLPSVTEFIKPVIEADGLIFVIPEYNGSYPGILKLFIDYLPFPESFKMMPIAFIGESKGAFGGLRAVEQFQMVVNYRNALQFPESLYISRVHKEFSEEDGLKDDFQQKLLLSQMKNFVKFIKAINHKKIEQLDN
ncbi:MAG: NADPH-dependent FMN reductase [Balneolaceae bacterium]